jgi:hypothetical protein
VIEHPAVEAGRDDKADGGVGGSGSAAAVADQRLDLNAEAIITQHFFVWGEKKTGKLVLCWFICCKRQCSSLLSTAGN